LQIASAEYELLPPPRVEESHAAEQLEVQTTQGEPLDSVPAVHGGGGATPPVRQPIQAPPTHPMLPPQTLPHDPQLVALVLVSTSQPFVRLFMSQSAKPAAHAPSHTPPPQVTVGMLLPEQGVPHAPQFDALVAVSISQPSDCLFMLQSANPLLHAPSQTPAVHVTVAMLAEEQIVPHPPQFMMSVPSMFVSQPFVSLSWSQSEKPVVQVPAQTPAVQTGVVMFSDEHACPHPPQSATFELVSTQTWLQQARVTPPPPPPSTPPSTDPLLSPAAPPSVGQSATVLHPVAHW
jgi:hypothetical protein